MKRVFGQLVGAGEQIVEERALAFEITFEQGVGEFALVGEMVEKKPLLVMPT